MTEDFDDVPDTNPGGRISNSDLLEYLKTSDFDREERAKKRHKTIVDEIGAIKSTLADHHSRLTRVEHNSFPVLVLWVIALVLGIGVYVNYWHSTVR